MLYDRNDINCGLFLQKLTILEYFLCTMLLYKHCFAISVDIRNGVSFVYKGNPHQFEWNGYGIELVFEGHCLSTDISKCGITIYSITSTESLLPQDIQLVSALFQINCDARFIKPVTIKIQHCAAEHKLSDLCFVTSTDKNPPYIYQCDDGHFNSNYGEIKVLSFSEYGIGKKKSHSKCVRLLKWFWPKTSGVLYSICLYHTKKFTANEQNYWMLSFIVVQNIPKYLSYVEDFATKLNMKRSGVVIMEFNDDGEKIQFVACLDKTKEVNVTNITSPSLSKSVIDKYEHGFPPNYKLELISSGQGNISIKFEIKDGNLYEFIIFSWPSFGK